MESVRIWRRLARQNCDGCDRVTPKHLVTYITHVLWQPHSVSHYWKCPLIGHKWIGHARVRFPHWVSLKENWSSCYHLVFDDCFLRITSVLVCLFSNISKNACGRVWFVVVEGGVEQWVEGVVPGEAGWHSCQPSHQLCLPYFSSPLTPEKKAVWYVWVGEGSWKAFCTWITVNKNSFLPSARSFLPQGYFLLCYYYILQRSVCILVHLIMYLLVESMCLSYVGFFSVSVFPFLSPCLSSLSVFCTHGWLVSPFHCLKLFLSSHSVMSLWHVTVHLVLCLLCWLYLC